MFPDDNQARNWRVWADCAQVLMAIARPLRARDPTRADLKQSLYAPDSITIRLVLLAAASRRPPNKCASDGAQVTSRAIMSNKLNATRNPHRYSVGNLWGKRYHPTLEEQTVVSCELQFPYGTVYVRKHVT